VVKGNAHPHASLSCFKRGVSHAGNAVELFVEENHVRDFTELGTLFADLLFDIKHSSRVFLLNAEMLDTKRSEEIITPSPKIDGPFDLLPTPQE